jgi:hypothetical protein
MHTRRHARFYEMSASSARHRPDSGDDYGSIVITRADALTAK